MKEKEYCAETSECHIKKKNINIDAYIGKMWDLKIKVIL